MNRVDGGGSPAPPTSRLSLTNGGQSAEYGTFRRDLRCAKAKLPVCRCASPKISGVLVCTKPNYC